jgi:hypothetical protein
LGNMTRRKPWGLGEAYGESVKQALFHLSGMLRLCSSGADQSTLHLRSGGAFRPIQAH